MKIKNLIKKFSFIEILKTCEAEGWRLPTLAEAKQGTFMHDMFWISDVPDNEADIETHALLYKPETDKTYLVNKSFIEPTVVIVTPQICGWKYFEDQWHTECNYTFSFNDNTVPFKDYFKTCPYCGRNVICST